jgi:nicotinamidase-related amidase
MDPYLSPEHEHSALITIDIQRDTLDGQPFEIPGTSAILPRVRQLLDFFRARSRPIIHVVRLYLRDGSNVEACRRNAIMGGSPLVLAGSVGSQIAEPLLPLSGGLLDADRLLAGDIQQLGPQEAVIYKPRWGAFYRTPLESHLRSLGATTLIFTGCNFPNCPRTSIYEASERDFRLVAIRDAISGLDAQGEAQLERIGVVVWDTKRYLEEAVSHTRAR